jgi:hypothetical protein
VRNEGQLGSKLRFDSCVSFIIFSPTAATAATETPPLHCSVHLLPRFVEDCEQSTRPLEIRGVVPYCFHLSKSCGLANAICSSLSASSPLLTYHPYLCYGNTAIGMLSSHPSTFIRIKPHVIRLGLDFAYCSDAFYQLFVPFHTVILLLLLLCLPGVVLACFCFLPGRRGENWRSLSAEAIL